MKNTERINRKIINNVRENLGLEPDDESKDDKINAMTNDEIFGRWCEWEGLIGYSYVIKGVIEKIYGVKLEDR